MECVAYVLCSCRWTIFYSYGGWPYFRVFIAFPLLALHAFSASTLWKELSKNHNGYSFGSWFFMVLQLDFHCWFLATKKKQMLQHTHTTFMCVHWFVRPKLVKMNLKKKLQEPKTNNKSCRGTHSKSKR